MTHDRNPPRQPLFWAALAFSLGLWTGVRAWRPPSWWMVALVVFGLAASKFLAKRAWLAKTLSLAMWVLLGAFLIQIRTHSRNENSANTPAILDFADGRDVTLTAHVIKEGYVQETHPGATRQPIDVETEEIASGGTSSPVRAGVRLSIYEKSRNHDPVERPASPPGHDATGHDPASIDSPQNITATNETPVAPPTFTYGTRLLIVAKLHPVRNYRNPGAFDYEGYLRDNGIAVLGSADAKDIQPLPGFSGSRIELWRTRLHSSIIAKIHQLWSKPQASLMDAMVLGEESFLHNSTRTEYQRSGTYHLLVVSGMNLSILAFAIFWALRQVRVDPAIAAITTVVVSFAYAFIVGVGPPVWRAALMLATYLGARLLYRERNMMNAIGAAALGVLIVDPHALFVASFQLTFLAVFIIAAIGSPILERTTLPYARGLRLLRSTSYDLHLAPAVAQFRLDLRLIAGRLRRFIGDRLALASPAIFMRVAIGLTELIFISALMQAGLALLMAYHFHRATTMGMPANLAVIPLTQVLMPAAAAAVGLGYISTTLAKPAVWISSFALDGIAGTVHWLGGSQGHPGTSIADIRVAMPSLLMIMASVVALALAMFAARRARRAAFASLTLLFAVAFWIAFVPVAPPHSPRRHGDDHHRRRTRGFHTAGYARRPHPSRRCGRFAAMDALRFRSWRTGGLFLSMESRHRSSRYCRNHASSRRSSRRNACSDCELPSRASSGSASTSQSARSRRSWRRPRGGNESVCKKRRRSIRLRRRAFPDAGSGPRSNYGVNASER